MKRDRSDSPYGREAAEVMGDGGVVGIGIGAGEGIGVGGAGSRSNGVTAGVAWVMAGSLPLPCFLVSNTNLQSNKY